VSATKVSLLYDRLHNGYQQALKFTNVIRNRVRIRLGAKKSWCILSVGAEFVWRMEDVLDVYAMPCDPHRPQVCLDEHSVQLIAETRVPLPAKAGRPERFDYEYERCGTRNLFMFFQPLGGLWRLAPC